MSFYDMEAGLSGQVRPVQKRQPIEDREYTKLMGHITTRILTVTKNIALIQQRIERLGVSQDHQREHERVHLLIEQTRELIKEISKDIKKSGTFKSEGEDEKQRRLEHQKLSRDFQIIMAQFQNVQRFAADKSRELMDKARTKQQQLDQIVSHEERDMVVNEQQPLLSDIEHRLQQQRILDNEIQFNDMLIAEREDEIQEIEQGIAELNEIFRDLGTIVTEQQSLMDNIERNVTSVAIHTQRASDEVATASRYQRRARKLMCYLLLILSTILAFVILLVLVV